MKGLLRVTGKTGWEVRQETALWSSDERLGEARSQDRPRWPARVARPGGPPRWPAQGHTGQHTCCPHLLQRERKDLRALGREPRVLSAALP